MRSTGLEEEVKPAPARTNKKPSPSLQLPTIPMKRPSPPRDIKDPIVPPEKKLRIDKIDIPDRPGAIKLIPPKPKPLLQESDLFMDAITAATTKKEPKKRKRRLSVTKDASSSSPSSSPSREQPLTPTSPTQSILSQKSVKRRVKVTKTTHRRKVDENAPVESESVDKTEVSSGSPPRTPTDDNQEEEHSEAKKPKVDGELKGVLLYTKKKGPKRSISWKGEADLVEIRYFELDETERVNVTKTFGDMAKMDISSEREALQLSRKVGGEDSMEAQILWRIPFIIEQEDSLVIPGNKSLEKDIQFAREKSVLQALYFDKRRIPDSPEEPIPENHQMSDPTPIPLEDPESQEIDLRSTPWPEPKGQAPMPEPQLPPMFPNMQGPFNPNFNNMPPPGFPGMPPRFAVPGGPMGPGVPNNFVPPNVIPGGNMMGPVPNHPNMGPPNEIMMNPMNPNMFPPGPMNDGFGQGPEFPPMFNANPSGPPNNMFPPGNFNNNHRHNNNRGGGSFRRGNNSGGNWVRMNGSGGNWRRGGGGHRGGRMCKNVQNHGYCRNRENCPFVHP
ncbi:hypothetical protein JTB14_030158 [Gonioctena quinquepunctata]|nr:hypothetical protein JTB14_030158 [Gonioctena quinquepunctata]